MDPFRLLLNNIGHKLTKENLQSLMHIYNVPEGDGEKINSGLELFRYMMRRNYISHEKIGNLRKLMKKVRPRRKDLVRKVDIFIKTYKREFQTDDAGTSLDDLSESSEEDHQNKSGRLVTLENRDDDVICDIYCPHFYFTCRRVPSCYTLIMLFLLFCIIATLVFWYSDDPQICSSAINSNPVLKSAVPYILSLEILLLLIVIFLRLRSSGSAMDTSPPSPASGRPFSHYAQGKRSKKIGPLWLILLFLGIAIYYVLYLCQICYRSFQDIMGFI